MPRKKQEPKSCSIIGCLKPMLARGLCGNHYQTARKAGSIKINRPAVINSGGCRVEGCFKPCYGGGYCSAHYNKFHKYGDPLGFSGWKKEIIESKDYRKCSVEGCNGLGRTKGLCPAHYQRFLRLGDPTKGGIMRFKRPPKCSVDGCDKAEVAVGYCSAHYSMFRKHGDPLQHSPRHKKWTQKIIGSSGYVLLPIKDHPNSTKNGSHNSGRIPEHRFIMSEFLGRPLFDNENVHHKNGDKTDNRIENLELWVVVQPKGQRPIDLIEYARGILERYERDEEKFSGIYREEIKPKLRLVAAYQKNKEVKYHEGSS